MEEQGVISKITDPTDWCTNMVCVKKKDKDEIHLCIDPKDLNKALKSPHHPLKTVDSILSGIPDAKVFSVLDAKSSFYQIPLEKESCNLTCFATPFGRYVSNVLPYGVTVGSEGYRRTIEHLFMIYLFGVLCHYQHCTGHITTGSWKGSGNQYIQFVRVLYCKLPTNGKELPAFPLKAVPVIEPWPQRPHKFYYDFNSV